MNCRNRRRKCGRVKGTSKRESPLTGDKVQARMQGIACGRIMHEHAVPLHVHNTLTNKMHVVRC